MEIKLQFILILHYAYPVFRTVNDVVIKTRIASCIEYGDVQGTISTSDKTTAHGTVDESQVIVNSIAGTSQTLTITFDSGLDFNVVSNVSGLTLPIKRPLITNHNDYLLPFLTIPAGFWTNDEAGDWVAGDTIHTNPCAMPYWIVVYISANSEASDLELVSPYSNGISGNA